MDLLPWMEQWHMLPGKGDVILCAVSGGRDSVCLLHYLHALGAQRGFAVAAAHLNHLMRPTAERDAAFVRQLCREWGIPLRVEAVPVVDMARQWGIGVEEAGRRARYEFLERTADEMGAGRIATAHHLRDQAETVVLNLVRGTGPEGLGGIPPVRGRYIRPLLNTGREEIEVYLSEHGLAHVEDETNADLSYARNRLRLVLWPELESINAAAAEHIAAAAAVVRQENAYLDTLAAERLSPEGTEISRGELLAAPPVLQRRMIRLLLDRLPAGKKDVGAVHIQAILTLARRGGMTSLPGRIQAVCRGEVLALSMAPPEAEPLALTPGRYRWGGYTVAVDLEPPGEGGVLALPAAPGQTLSVRAWRADDRLTLPGSRGSRSLKRLFADAGVAPEQRSQLPVICLDDVPVAVYGVGAVAVPEEKKQLSPYYITITKES